MLWSIVNPKNFKMFKLLTFPVMLEWSARRVFLVQKKCSKRNCRVSCVLRKWVYGWIGVSYTIKHKIYLARQMLQERIISDLVNQRILYCCIRSENLFPWLHVMSNIAPSHIRRQEIALKECRKIERINELPIRGDLSSAPSVDSTIKIQKTVLV